MILTKILFSLSERNTACRSLLGQVPFKRSFLTVICMTSFEAKIVMATIPASCAVIRRSHYF